MKWRWHFSKENNSNFSIWSQNTFSNLRTTLMRTKSIKWKLYFFFFWTITFSISHTCYKVCVHDIFWKIILWDKTFTLWRSHNRLGKKIGTTYFCVRHLPIYLLTFGPLGQLIWFGLMSNPSVTEILLKSMTWALNVKYATALSFTSSPDLWLQTIPDLMSLPINICVMFDIFQQKQNQTVEFLRRRTWYSVWLSIYYQSM